MNRFKSDGKASVDSKQFACDKSAAISINNNTDKFPRLKPSRFQFDALKAELLQNLETPVDQPQKILIVHGLYALYDKELRDMSHIKVFIDSDPDTRLIRWIRRDVLKNNIDTLEGVINAYLLGARSEMSDFIFPTKEFADVIMPRGAESNAVVTRKLLAST
ncbi:Uridine kinase [Candida maltosa Xu316]|uniref:Uridine kinase n=1 Tax=Candida maltosa (strain Xu316) TaxID=1245528 RepID=M3JZE7_CANMX|nr:Uridine kinase [Candida maltosa Xu316]